MSDTILSSDFTIYYYDDNNRKQIRWTGTSAKDDVEKMIDVYDACEDLMTQPTQMDDGLIFSAETPGEYTIGKIDAGVRAGRGSSIADRRVGKGSPDFRRLYGEDRAVRPQPDEGLLSLLERKNDPVAAISGHRIINY